MEVEGGGERQRNVIRRTAADEHEGGVIRRWYGKVKCIFPIGKLFDDDALGGVHETAPWIFYTSYLVAPAIRPETR